jgi:hypothetical protein
LIYSGLFMKLTRRTSNILLAIGIFMLFSWTTRAYTWYTGDLQEQPGYIPFVHLVLILISLAIGAYLFYIGVKGQRATRRTA